MRRTERVLDEQVEEIVLHRPCNLAHQGQQNDDEPRFARQLRSPSVRLARRHVASPRFRISSRFHSNLPADLEAATAGFFNPTAPVRQQSHAPLARPPGGLGQRGVRLASTMRLVTRCWFSMRLPPQMIRHVVASSFTGSNFTGPICGLRRSVRRCETA